MLELRPQARQFEILDRIGFLRLRLDGVSDRRFRYILHFRNLSAPSSTFLRSRRPFSRPDLARAPTRMLRERQFAFEEIRPDSDTSSS